MRLLALTVASLGCVACHSIKALPEPTRHLAVAEAAGEWLVTEAQRDSDAWTWPACPDNGGAAVHNLYSGGAGVALLFAELHAATGDESWLQAAQAAARGLAANVENVAKQSGGGLFTGIGGMLLAMQVVWERTEDPSLDRAIETGLQWYWQRAGQAEVGGSVSFGPVTDVISGDAGIGELMLWLAKRRNNQQAADIAGGLARHLVEVAEDTAPGYRWMMSPTYARAMPNYSHGTGGVAAFLARASKYHRGAPTKAIGGGERLLHLADQRGMVFHNQLGGEDLFYWGWCHGPAGTSVLFSRLAKMTGDAKWTEAALRPVASVLQSGLPTARLPGLWNTVGQCCGTAGVGAYLLRVVPDDPSTVSFCEAIADDIRARATVDGGGLKWFQAEHRMRPDLLQAQVGWAQGASGIGLWFLELDGFLRGRPASFELPWTSVE
ncbi:MAG: hypothetical protein ACI9S9_004340 [Planctomycetota bacterium]|jgi:hypothetical protein